MDEISTYTCSFAYSSHPSISLSDIRNIKKFIKRNFLWNFMSIAVSLPTNGWVISLYSISQQQWKFMLQSSTEWKGVGFWNVYYILSSSPPSTNSECIPLICQNTFLGKTTDILQECNNYY